MSESFRLGDWEVCSASNTLKRKQVEIHLEPKMMDVLSYLAAHAGQVVSTEQLLLEFWQGTFYGDMPVQKCIAMLRKKMGDSPRAPTYIETIPRRGYRCIADVIELDSRQRWQTNAKPAPWTNGSPYRGLETFQAEHANVYFGRNKAIAEVTHLFNRGLEEQFPLLLIVGNSGSGKSSLARAGVIPYLQREEGFAGIKINTSQIITPSRDPELPTHSLVIKALDRMEVIDTGWQDATSSDIAGMCYRSPPYLRELIRKGSDCDPSLPVKKARHLLVIDQFEQILQDHTIDDIDRQKIIALLQEIVRSQQVMVMILVRADFYAKCMDISGFPSLKENGQHYDLTPPNATDIARMIRLPAIAAELKFEQDRETGEQLDEILLDATVRHPDALPLMEFTLDLLYQRRDNTNTLLFSVYDDIGRLEGAIARQAEITYQALDDQVKKSWDTVMHELVRVSEHGQQSITARKVPMSRFCKDADRNFIQRFVEARLFVTEGDVNDTRAIILVSVAHEALLKHWQRITDWVRQNQVALLKRAQLAADCQRWQSEGQRKDMLLSGGRKLNDALWLKEKNAIHLTDNESRFIALSFARQRVSGILRNVAIAALVVLTVTASALALHARNQTQLANRQTQQAVMLQDKAEALVDYMLGDLRGQLEPIGKLDVLEGVGIKTLDYYTDLNTSDPLRQANALKLVAEINVSKEKFNEARAQLMEALHHIESNSFSGQEYTESLFLAGNLYYWLGLIPYYQKNYELALKHWSSYVNLSQALLEIEPDNLNWGLEYSYALNNVGSVLLKLEDFKAAKQQFAKGTSMQKALMEQSPGNPKFSSPYRSSLLWTALLNYRHDNIQESIDLASSAFDIAFESSMSSPDNYTFIYELLSTANSLIKYKISSNIEPSLHELNAMIKSAHALQLHDPYNQSWNRQIEITLVHLIELKFMGLRIDSPLIAQTVNDTVLAYANALNGDFRHSNAVLNALESARPEIANKIVFSMFKHGYLDKDDALRYLQRLMSRLVGVDRLVNQLYASEIADEKEQIRTILSQLDRRGYQHPFSLKYLSVLRVPNNASRYEYALLQQITPTKGRPPCQINTPEPLCLASGPKADQSPKD